MTLPNPHDPYAGNILTEHLGPILSRAETLARLTFLPTPPGNMDGVPKHIRLHMLPSLRDLHVPSLEGARAAETIDLMTRQGYRYRDPVRASTWSMVANASNRRLFPAPAMSAAMVGHSGVGKTMATKRRLSLYPSQVITHPTFPKLVGPHYQVVWLSADVPPSGRAADLAANLMSAMDEAFARYLPDRPPRFAVALARGRRNGSQMLDEWMQVAKGHFLGVLHLDEIQNFFKVPTLEQRSRRKVDSILELSLIEDQALKSIITFTNTAQIPLVISGTPDGISALSKRLSNVQRFVTCGYHKMEPFQSAEDKAFEFFVDQLARYQFVLKPITVDRELRCIVFQLTAGIQRLIVCLWIAAHRVAFERKVDDLRIDDFKRAAGTLLAPVAPAVAALLSKDPRQMARYEDLMPRDEGFWSSFWSRSASS